MSIRDVEVTFEQWYCDLGARELRKWGSPHFDRKQVGAAIANIFMVRGAIRDSGSASFLRDLITVSNHAYPEAALVDPVADLELWEEWKQGIREFPYLGRYAPLGIFRQEGKTSSATSVGVLGEILAGRFAEAVVAPTVLVRVVRRWPDFILYAKTGSTGSNFAFVESKAIGPGSMPRNALCKGRVPDALFAELAEQVVRQLNADPYVDVWGAFTYIRTIEPTQLDVTFLQFVAADDKKAQAGSPSVPEVVLQGLAERAVSATLMTFSEGRIVEFLATSRRSRYRKETEAEIVAGALQQLREIVASELDAGVSIADEDIASHIDRAVGRLPEQSDLPGRKTREARGPSWDTARLLPIGSAGGQMIVMADLPRVDEELLKHEWRPDWRNAGQPWAIQNGTSIWRAGGALFAIGDSSLEGMPVIPKAVERGGAAV